MPQMAPMNWLMLFMMFTMIFFMFNSLNYFSFIYKPKIFNLNNNNNNKMINWKW